MSNMNSKFFWSSNFLLVGGRAFGWWSVGRWSIDGWSMVGGRLVDGFKENRF